MVTNVIAGVPVLAAASHGTLYVAGTERDHNLGRGQGNETLARLTKVTPAFEVYFLPYGNGQWTHAALTAEGVLYSWGRNERGQGGVGSAQSTDFVVAKFDNDAKVSIRFVASGPSYTFAIDQDGVLWASGATAHGGAGLPETSTNTTVFHRVETGARRWVFASAGAGDYSGPSSSTDVWCSLAIDTQGALYGWGLSTNGILGKTLTETTALLALDPKHRRWTWVSHNRFHAAAITEDGSLYTWGGASAALGYQTTDAMVTEPTEVAVWDGAKKVRFVKVVVAEKHMLALDTAGHVWAWGTNEHFCLGMSVVANASSVPAKVTTVGEGCLDIAAGWRSGGAIGKDGAIWTWGYDSYGELAQEDSSGTEVSTPRVATLDYAKLQVIRIAFGEGSLFAVVQQRPKADAE